jgi:hypothetical protein
MKHTSATLIALPLLCLLLANCTSENKNIDSFQDSSSKIVENTVNAKKVDTIASDTNSVINNSKDWLLIPGTSAGKTRLKENSAEVFKLLGRADGGDAAMGKSVAIWYTDHDSTANSIAIYTARDTGDAPKALVKQIRVTSSQFRTTEGVATGSNLATIKNYFTITKAEDYKDDGKSYTVYSNNKGIAFEMSSNDKCVAIIIFEAGKTVPGTYLKFRTTNKFITRPQ